MRKKILVLAVVIMAISLCLSLAGIASAASPAVEVKSEYFMGEYGNMFSDRDDLSEEYKNYLKENNGLQAVIIYGQITDMSADYDYGIALYPSDSTYDSANARIYRAKSVSEDGYFGIALSLSADFMNSGSYKAMAFAIDKNATLTANNCTWSTAEMSFSTSTEKYDKPVLNTISEPGIVTWSKVEGASAYKVQLRVEGTEDWFDVATVESETYDVTDYLKTLSGDELKALDSKYLSVRVAADGYDKMMSDYATISGGTESNIFSIVDGTNNYRIQAVETWAELVAVSNVNTYDYIVLVDDIAIEGNVAKAPQASYSVSGLALTSAKLDGLGHTISYTYNDSEYAKAEYDTDSAVDGVKSGQNFHGLWLSSSAAIVGNLNLEVTLTSNKNTDDFHFSLLAATLKKVYNTSIKSRSTFSNASFTPSASKRTRIKVSTCENYTNCLFDMVSYNSSGAVVTGGNNWYDNCVSSGAATITNCVYITNDASTTKPWSRYSTDENSLTNSGMYASITSFVTAWKETLTTDAKTAYQNAGIKVDSDKLYFQGNEWK